MQSIFSKVTGPGIIFRYCIVIIAVKLAEHQHLQPIHFFSFFHFFQGARRTIDAIELLFARQYFIMHVRGYGFQAVDMVDINFRGGHFLDIPKSSQIERY